jgi:transposase
MEFISGESRNQTLLLPDSVEKYIDSNNAVRVIDAYINSLCLEAFGFVHTVLCDTGRPPYDPKDMLKLYVYGYMNRIRSSRRLETETKRNLEVIWLLRRLSPDHKTIARFRHDNPRGLKNVFRDFVRLCVREDLYGRELIAIDGSKFKAVNSKDRNFTGEKLAERIKRIDARIEEYLRELNNGDLKENDAGGEKTAQELKGIINRLSERRQQYKEYEEELERTGETQKSLTDPDSRLMLSNGKMDVCYNVQMAVDAKNKMIVEFEATNKANDSNQITPMGLRAKEILETDTITAVTDAGYDSAKDIAAAISEGIDVHVAGTDYDVCVPADDGDKGEITTHHNGKCVYNAERNIAICPMGKVLYPGYYKKARGHGVFYNSKACKECTCRCTKEDRSFRCQVAMAEADFSKEYNDKGLLVKQMRIKPDKTIIRERKSIAEHPFGTIKRAMEAGYCLTKGLRGVGGEFSLIFLAYNIKRAINILGVKKMIESMGTEGSLCPFTCDLVLHIYSTPVKLDTRGFDTVSLRSRLPTETSSIE